MTSIFGFLENPQEVYNSVVVVVFDSLGEMGEGGEVENMGERRKSMKEKGGEKRRARLLLFFQRGGARNKIILEHSVCLDGQSEKSRNP